VKRSNWPLPAAAIVLMTVAAGCVTAPQYDDQTDKQISQLQTDIDTQIVTLITLDHKIQALTGKTDATSQKALADATSRASYDANTAFYDKVDVDLTTLQTRVDSEPSAATPHLDSSLKNLHDNLLTADGSMQLTHQKVTVLSATYLQSAQVIVDAQIGALLTRELGLKNAGASKPATNTAAAK
jgi:hypothetical protein